MDCQVRNFSPNGARVAFTNAATVPDQFDLTIGRKERSFKARMVWRSVNEAGVAFLGEYDQAVPTPLNGPTVARMRGRKGGLASAHRAIDRQ
jgi:hypothetical protein